LSNHENFERFGLRLLLVKVSDRKALGTYKERDEDCRVHEHQCQHSSPAVSKASCDGSGQKDTNKSTALARLKEGTLPLRGDGPVCRLRPSLDAICLCENT
jgi:hypothetical protein